MSQYLRLRKEDFKINESERIVYVKENQLAYPHEFATLIYHLSETKKHSQTKVILLDLEKQHEIFQLACATPEDEVLRQFQSWKYVKLNDELDTALNVSRFGCNICTENEYNITSLSNLVEDDEYDFQFMERNLVRQMLTTVHCSEEREHLAFVGNFHLLRLLPHFTQELQTPNNSAPAPKPADSPSSLNKLLRQSYLKPSYDEFLSTPEASQK